MSSYEIVPFPSSSDRGKKKTNHSGESSLVSAGERGTKAVRSFFHPFSLPRIRTSPLEERVTNISIRIRFPLVAIIRNGPSRTGRRSVTVPESSMEATDAPFAAPP
ncbi:MAG: hypothetical protein Fur0034_04190 [Desulfuromonadia bacterium]